MSTKEYSWSSNEETYQGRFDSIEDALADATDTLDGTFEGTATVWVGELEPIHAKSLVSAAHIIEQMQERASDMAGEAADDYLQHVTKEQSLELEALVAEWAQKVDPISFWAITKTTEHYISEGCEP